MKGSAPKTLEAIVTWLNPARDMAKLKTMKIWGKNDFLPIFLPIASYSVRPFVRGGVVGAGIGAVVSKAIGLDMHQSIAMGYVIGLGTDCVQITTGLVIDMLRTEYRKCEDCYNTGHRYFFENRLW